MERKIEKKSQPWWVIFLIIPILVSCTAFTPVSLVWEVVLSIGGEVIGTYVGITIENVFDEAFKQIFHIVPTRENSIDENPETPGRVISDPDNPLHGTFSKTIKFETTDPRTHERRVIELNPATFDWHPETSKWQLDSKSKTTLNISENSEQKPPGTNEKTGFPVVIAFVGLGIIIAIPFALVAMGG